MKDLLTLDKGTLKTVITAVQEFSLWFTLALAAALLIAFVIVWFKKKDALAGFKKVFAGVVIGYSVTLIAVILYLQIARMKVKGELDANFFLFVGFFCTLLVTVVAGLIIGRYAPKASKYFTYIALAVIVIYSVILLVTLPTVTDWISDDEQHYFAASDNAVYYILTAVLVLAIIALGLIFGKDDGTASQTKSLAYAGVCVALSFALSYIKFFSVPGGGSATLASMLPLMLYAYIFGARKGLFAGVIYGVLQFIQNPSVYEPMQVLLDYPIAFSALGLAGIAKNFKFLKGNMLAEFIAGMTIACLFRYFAHVISGYFVFYVYAGDMNPLAYSFLANCYVMFDLVVDIVAGVLLLSSKSMRKYVRSINPEPQPLEA